MAIQSPALSLAVPAMFGNIKPVVDAVRKLGMTDFAADANGIIDVKPGATIKVPVSSISAASAFDESANNYLTGGVTTWADMTCVHYLQGFDINGTNLDEGVNAPRMRQLFASRAGSGIAAAVQDAVAGALDAVTASSITAPTTVDGVLALGDDIKWLNKSTSMLAVNGTFLASMKKLLASEHITGTPDELAQYCGFAGCVLVPGMTASCAIVPASAMGFLGRVPAIVASYQETGTEVDQDSGLAVGVVVANDQGKNRVVVNADLWFGATAIKGSTSVAGVVKIA